MPGGGAILKVSLDPIVLIKVNLEENHESDYMHRIRTAESSSVHRDGKTVPKDNEVEELIYEDETPQFAFRLGYAKPVKNQVRKSMEEVLIE